VSVKGEETMHVKVRIRYDEGEEGLNVEVEGPVKLTTDYMNHVVSRSERKMLSAIKGSTLPQVRNGAGPTLSTGGDCNYMRMNICMDRLTM